MRIEHLKVNHLVNPVGYDLEHPTISYVVTQAQGQRQKTARVQVSLSDNFDAPLYDSGEQEELSSVAFELPVQLEPLTRYYWRVFASDETGDCAWSEVQYFETAKTVSGSSAAWEGQWITPDLPKEVQSVVQKRIQIDKPVKRARAYMVGLGVYEFYLNGEKQGEECLLPGFCSYDSWIQYQTFELAPAQGSNLLEIVLGDGWYKGWYGLRQTSENYGDRLAALAEIHIWYEDGTKEIIGTDETWSSRKSRVVYSGIYPGEIYDATLDTSETFGVRYIELGYDRLYPRLSPRITVHERIRPVEVIHTPTGETVLDMGQNMVGWLQFVCRAPKGTKLFFQFGEILQDGNFYRDNLRTAKAEFTYIADGAERLVRQHFTFYGYRYVKVTGWNGEPDPEDFRGLEIHSDMEEIGSLRTSDELVNQLIHNAKWGMKDNFLDVPTDCPQRDERCGWTGDAQIFSGTACYFMDTYAFYTKYGRDVAAGQKSLGGAVPDVAPLCNYQSGTSTAWGDAATIIPWNVYLHSGDKSILRRQYESMHGWVEYMKREDDLDGGKRLWLNGQHYGDWLALDGNYPGGVFGGTDTGLIASGYYYLSTTILYKTAKLLGKSEDAARYEELAGEIHAAFVKEYFTKTGRLAVDTMTAYVVVLYMGLCPEEYKDRVRKGLLNKLKKNFYHLETGFVGTPYLCRVLSGSGMNEMAYHLLLEKGYPGWLYAVLMGATTIWERWNSVNPDGKISGTEMNSLNHYSYGSIVEWMFRHMVGIVPEEEAAGFKKFRLSPQPNYQIGHAEGCLSSAAGVIHSAWRIEEEELHFAFTVPFDTEAVIVLPDADEEEIAARIRQEGIKTRKIEQTGRNTTVTVGAGEYTFVYQPTVPYRKIYSLDSTLQELKENPKTLEILEKEFGKGRLPFGGELCTLDETTASPFVRMTKEDRERLDAELRAVK